MCFGGKFIRSSGDLGACRSGGCDWRLAESGHTCSSVSSQKKMTASMQAASSGKRQV